MLLAHPPFRRARSIEIDGLVKFCVDSLVNFQRSGLNPRLALQDPVETRAQSCSLTPHFDGETLSVATTGLPRTFQRSDLFALHHHPQALTS